jgi:hypothetical protein
VQRDPFRGPFEQMREVANVGVQEECFSSAIQFRVQSR